MLKYFSKHGCRNLQGFPESGGEVSAVKTNLLSLSNFLNLLFIKNVQSIISILFNSGKKKMSIMSYHNARGPNIRKNPILSILKKYQNGSKIKSTPPRKNPPRKKLRFGPKKTTLILYDHWVTPVDAI